MPESMDAGAACQRNAAGAAREPDDSSRRLWLRLVRQSGCGGGRTPPGPASASCCKTVTRAFRFGLPAGGHVMASLPTEACRFAVSGRTDEQCRRARAREASRSARTQCRPGHMRIPQFPGRMLPMDARRQGHTNNSPDRLSRCRPRHRRLQAVGSKCTRGTRKRRRARGEGAKRASLGAARIGRNRQCLQPRRPVGSSPSRLCA